MMKPKAVWMAAGLSLLGAGAGCAQKAPPGAAGGLAVKPQASQEARPSAPTPLTPAQRAQVERGREVYEVTCIACHQADGKGHEGLAPSLVGSEWVGTSSERLIRIVLHGLEGSVKVEAQDLELFMPPLGILDDAQIADALTYIRQQWGHAFSPVSVALVQKVRQETAQREAPWTREELLKIR